MPTIQTPSQRLGLPLPGDRAARTHRVPQRPGWGQPRTVPRGSGLPPSLGFPEGELGLNNESI